MVRKVRTWSVISGGRESNGAMAVGHGKLRTTFNVMSVDVRLCDIRAADNQTISEVV